MVPKFSNTYKTFTFFLISSLLPFAARSQAVRPQPNDTLNYTQVMFEYPQVEGAAHYLLEIGEESREMDRILFKKNVKSLALLVDTVLEFGKSYIWRYRGIHANGEELFISRLFQFRISDPEKGGPRNFQHQIVRSVPEKTFPSLVVYDAGVVSNKAGKVIHYFPKNDGTLRDLVLNKDGTFTYTNSHGIFETDLKGKITWQGPPVANKIQIRTYHHAVRKLPGGNFLCLAEKVHTTHNKIYSVVFETDRRQNIKWLWDEETYYANRKDTLSSNHVNSIDFEPSRGVLIVGSRNTSTISKINVKMNRFVYTIGGCLDSFPETRCYPWRLFSGQHSVSLLPNKNLLLFNNNADKPEPSAIIEMKQPVPGDSVPQVVFRYDFNFPDTSYNKSPKAGDADLLPNDNIMVTCGANNKTFEVTREGKIVWECNTFRRDHETDPWIPQSSYRTHFISSLFPCYFTVENIPGPGGIQLKLNNDGSENDEYTITFRNDAGKELHKKVSVDARNSSLMGGLTPFLKPLKGKNLKTRISIKITSGLDQRFTRLVTITI